MQIIRNWISKQIFLCFLLLGFAGGLYAVEVQLYQIELPTQNQTGNFDQAQLLKEAFQTVLVRISGSRQFLNDNESVITNALKDIDTYIKQFSYHQRSASEKTIKVVFNENRINALLNLAKQSVWEKHRPLTLVWLEGADSEPMIAPDIEKLFNQRAIPFVFPLMDLTDTVQVSDQDLFGENTESLEKAAKRYNPDVILLGRVHQQNGVWQAHWRIINNGEKTAWDNTGSELNVMLNQAADALALKLKGGNIVVAATDQTEKSSAINQLTLTLTVSGSLDAEQYSKILEHLRRLPAVSAVEVAQIMPDKTLFELVTTESQEMLVKSIGDGQVLRKTSSAEGLTSEDGLVYEIVSGVS